MKPEYTASNRPANMAALAITPVGRALWDYHDGLPAYLLTGESRATRRTVGADNAMNSLVDSGILYPENKIVYRLGAKCGDVVGCCIYDDTGYMFTIRIPEPEPAPVIAGCEVCGNPVSGDGTLCPACLAAMYGMDEPASDWRADPPPLRGIQTTPATLTLQALADKINDHLEAGGYVLDYCRDCAPDLITKAVYVDEDPDYGYLVLHCPFNWGPTIPQSDVLEDKGNVVTYASGPHHTGSFCGELHFLIPAPLSAATAPSPTNLNP